jgi:hypothetical protein
VRWRERERETWWVGNLQVEVGCVGGWFGRGVEEEQGIFNLGSTHLDLEIVLRWCVAIDWWMWGSVHGLHCAGFALIPGQEELEPDAKVLNMIRAVRMR